MMKITLWGDHARDFSINNIFDSETGNLIVCLVVGCTPREDIKNNGNSSFTIPFTSANCIYMLTETKATYFYIPEITQLYPFVDRPCLTESSACSYYLNPDIPEARPFHSR